LIRILISVAENVTHARYKASVIASVYLNQKILSHKLCNSVSYIFMQTVLNDLRCCCFQN